MRVIAGSAKGIQLQAVPGAMTRPISDRVKEALFDILGTAVVGARVLDLFAGTGSVAIEALSRGAKYAVLVEKSPRAIRIIRSNLSRTRLGEQAIVIQSDVFRYLAASPKPFNLVYLAPPQYQGLWSKALLQLDSQPGWLEPGGLVVVQVFPKEWQSLPLQALQIVDQRKYGSTLLALYQVAETQ
jgi:16S rRNA (guanine(966)-N(2))-methyltransferase RsmD